MSAGNSHTCGLTADGLAYCWGDNRFGQLGNGTTGSEQSSAVAVTGGLHFRQITAGSEFTCAVAPDNRAYCWGANFYGNLGDGTTDHHSRPVAVNGRRFRQVSAGSQHACGVNPNDVVFCWGSGWYGQLGDGVTGGTPVDRLVPVLVAAGGRRFSEVSAGLGHTCAVGMDALVYCWGFNSAGQLGDGTTVNRSAPVPIRGGRSFLHVVTGSQHSCGVTTGNAAYCWGFDNHGQLGDGASGYARRRVIPIAVLGGLQFSDVTAGGYHTCGLTTNERAYCWGSNQYGQLGLGHTEDRLVLSLIIGARRFAQVAAGSAHTCGTTVGEVAYCWGNNLHGQLGNNSTDLSPIPVAVVVP